MTDEGGKRKREGSEEEVSNLYRLVPPATALESSAADTPIQSPASSTSGLPSTNNGHGARSASEKVMRRNIDRVLFGAYDIKTWYYSPYPFDEEEWATMTDGGNSTSTPAAMATSNHRRNKQADGRHFSPATSSSTRESSLSRPGGALSTSAEKAPALQALTIEAPLLSRKDSQQNAPMAKTMWVCDGCFKYMRTYGGYTVHKKDCKQTHPPGRKVYQRGAHIIWEVDGARQKLYAQNLSLFGKLFIDHKTIYFDVEPFTFYVLTDASSQFDHALGFFSKEKISYDDYNLACIITFPPYQKKGYGTLMIEFSYYLSSLGSTLGTPERPLSDLGFKGYLSYWCAVALRTLALFFYDQKPSISSCLLPASHALITPTRGNKQLNTSSASNQALAEARQKKETLRIRKILSGEGISSLREVPEPRAGSSEDGLADENKAKRGVRGWAGEMPKGAQSASVEPKDVEDGRLASGALSDEVDSKTSALLHIANELGQIVFQTTLERLSAASNLRQDDLCFALAELGLLSKAKEKQDGKEQIDEADGLKTIVISQDAVRSAIEYNRVKRPILDVNYVLPSA